MPLGIETMFDELAATLGGAQHRGRDDVVRARGEHRGGAEVGAYADDRAEVVWVLDAVEVDEAARAGHREQLAQRDGARSRTMKHTPS